MSVPPTIPAKSNQINYFNPIQVMKKHPVVTALAITAIAAAAYWYCNQGEQPIDFEITYEKGRAGYAYWINTKEYGILGGFFLDPREKGTIGVFSLDLSRLNKAIELSGIDKTVPDKTFMVTRILEGLGKECKVSAFETFYSAWGPSTGNSGNLLRDCSEVIDIFYKRLPFLA